MRTRMWVAAIATGLALVALLTSSAQADWSPVGGNIDPSGIDNGRPSAATIGGVPYVAWIRGNDPPNRIQVARLDSAGTGWESLGGPALLPNSPNDNQAFPSIVSFGGVPYVAFTELEAHESQIRVVRLNSSGQWEQVGPTLSHDDGESASNPNLAVIAGELWLIWDETFGGPNKRIYAAKLVNLSTIPNWQFVGNALNYDVTQNATLPRLTDVGGVPYAAWREFNTDDTHYHVRVARYTNGAWQVFADNLFHDGNVDTSGPAIATVGGIPFVTWHELAPGGSDEVWVARPNSVGNAWANLDGSPSGPSAQHLDTAPDIVGIGGAPYVAWTNGQAGDNHQLLVARFDAALDEWAPVGSPLGSIAASPRLAVAHGVPWAFWTEGVSSPPFSTHAAVLQPDFLAQTAFPTDTGAMFATRVRTFGFPYDVGFDFGPGSGLGASTPTTTTVDGAQVDTIFQTAAGLQPTTSYSFAPFAGYGFPSTALGPVGSFTTKAVNGPGPAGPAGPGGPPGPPGSPIPASKVRLSCPVTRTSRAARRRSCTVRFASNVKENVRGTLTRRKRLYASGRGAAVRGPTKLRLRETRALPIGAYTLTLSFKQSAQLASVLVLHVRVKR